MPSFVIFDIRALWRSALSVRVPGCQKLQNRSGTGCFICTHNGNSGQQRVKCSRMFANVARFLYNTDTCKQCRQQRSWLACIDGRKYTPACCLQLVMIWVMRRHSLDGATNTTSSSSSRRCQLLVPHVADRQPAWGPSTSRHTMPTGDKLSRYAKCKPRQFLRWWRIVALYACTMFDLLTSTMTLDDMDRAPARLSSSNSSPTKAYKAAPGLCDTGQLFFSYNMTCR